MGLSNCVQVVGHCSEQEFVGPCSIPQIYLMVTTAITGVEITNNTRDAEKGFIFNRDGWRNPATKGSAKWNRPYIITNRLSFVILRSVQETIICCLRWMSDRSSFGQSIALHQRVLMRYWLCEKHNFKKKIQPNFIQTWGPSLRQFLSRCLFNSSIFRSFLKFPL